MSVLESVVPVPYTGAMRYVVGTRVNSPDLLKGLHALLAVYLLLDRCSQPDPDLIRSVSPSDVENLVDWVNCVCH
jgi:hypothetical protein